MILSKKCTKCGEKKLRSDFYERSASRDGLYSWCKKCHRAITAGAKIKNRDKVLARDREYRKKNKAAIAKYHHDRRHLRRKENNENYNQWSRKNPWRCAANYMAYHARKLNRLPEWADREEMVGFYEEAHSLTKETGELNSVDHIVPLRGANVSGLHVPNNLQVMTQYENRAKWNEFRDDGAL